MYCIFNYSHHPVPFLLRTCNWKFVSFGLLHLYKFLFFKKVVFAISSLAESLFFPLQIFGSNFPSLTSLISLASIPYSVSTFYWTVEILQQFFSCPSDCYLSWISGFWFISCYASLVAQLVKNPPAVRENWVRLGRSPGEGNGYSLQYSWLENSMDRGAWQAAIHEVTKGQTQLSN